MSILLVVLFIDLLNHRVCITTFLQSPHLCTSLTEKNAVVLSCLVIWIFGVLKINM